MQVLAVPFSTQPGDSLRLGRTLRSLRAAGLSADESVELTGQTLGELLQQGGPLLLIRAGAWLLQTDHFAFPPSSASGKGLCALGALRTPPETEPETLRQAALWQALFARTGGDFGAQRGCLPPPACLYLDARAATALAAHGPSSLSELLGIASETLRLVHYAPLDVYDDPGLRVLQVITALQRGGAERMTLDLMAELPAHQVRTRLAMLGRPLREAFETPPRTFDLARAGATPEVRALALLRAAAHFGADLVHGHLISGTDVGLLSEAGLPAVVSVHNTRPGWPEGLVDLPPLKGVLLAACAQAVEADLRTAKVPLPVRTAWNGIDLEAFAPTPDRLAAGRAWRQRWGFSDADFVLLALANPRPQKRLHLLPPILAALRASLGLKAQARLVLCGEAMPGNPHAQQCVAQTRAEIARLGLEPQVRWTGPVADVPALLAAADVLLSTSAHEGLSLAQLEALAMGRAVVATNVGGAQEIAHNTPDVHLLSPEAAPEAFAEVLAKLAIEAQSCAKGDTATAQRSAFGVDPPGCSVAPAPEPDSLQGGHRTRRPSPEHWSRQTMARRYQWLYPRVIAAARRTRPGRGLWLVTNNFSTGGAQTSARRLLTGLAAQGVPVRAAVIEEDPGRPTPGRQALLAAGIHVLSIPGAAAIDPSLPVAELLAAIDADPPQSVLFWNLRPAFKVLLADALLDIPLFDVSPGEMFFASLETYFAKSHPGLPYRSLRDYGARLAGVIVKYSGEAPRAAAALGAPVHVVPNGVPLRPEVSRAASHRSQLVLGTAARINPQKRLEDLLDALHLAHDRLPPYRLKIAGGVERGCEDYAARLRTLANGLPIDWLGEQADVPAFHRELDFFAMVSEPAGCPNASLEAMAAGLPVVATAVGGASEQVVDGRNGRLVPSRSPQPLADALVELATQPALRQKMAAASRQLIQERFLLERMLADYRRICLPHWVDQSDRTDRSEPIPHPVS